MTQALLIKNTNSFIYCYRVAVLQISFKFSLSQHPFHSTPVSYYQLETNSGPCHLRSVQDGCDLKKK